ncbi:hypothetical protein [Hyphomicrobium zavarzinii]|uniref:hypothetical protein n=1 Tax=Hyphomicrobium zavarzinii TaxID=48292 RepID=UPI00035ED6DF|nr:hypothetical protein [Hyphomicrobium zavarzinii]
MPTSRNDVALSLVAAFGRAEKSETPYRYWLLADCLPERIVDEVLGLPFGAADLDGVSGKRELHNQSRRYFDVENRTKFPCVSAVAAAFQDQRVTAAIEKSFDARLNGTHLRIEFAQDVDGFWLEPHTDIGVKAFTFLIYLSKGNAHADLGTDIYDAGKNWVGRTPYSSNSGMIFVPSTITYHGFERRRIDGVRKLLVVNYVTSEWRAKEQLAFPEQAVSPSSVALVH